MKPRRFVEIKARTDPALKRVHETFADPDKLTVTPADIEAMAKTLADSLRRRLAKRGDTVEPVTMIIEALQPEQILDGVFLEQAGYVVDRATEIEQDGKKLAVAVLREDSSGQPQRTLITSADIADELHHIRLAVADRLFTLLQLDPAVQRQVHTYLIDHKINGTVATVLPDRIYKRSTLMRGSGRGLQRLQDLPVHPNVSLAIRERASTGQQEIQERLHLTTLKDVLRQKPLPSLTLTLRYVRDFLQGCLYLTHNGLRLMDIKLDNMFIDTQHDRGVVHDLDGLRRDDERLRFLIGVERNFPPERMPYNNMIPLTEAEMVYQCGRVLEDIFKQYELQDLMIDEFPLSGELEQLQNLFKMMLQRVPTRRPTLEQVLTAIDLHHLAG